MSIQVKVDDATRGTAGPPGWILRAQEVQAPPACTHTPLHLALSDVFRGSASRSTENAQLLAV